ncbi:MAG: DUF2877 domain-containing protein [bacterium]
MNERTTEPREEIASFHPSEAVFLAKRSSSQLSTGQEIGILSCGDRITPGNYSFHSRFRRAINFFDDTNLVAIVDASIRSGPFNIVVANIESFAANSIFIDRASFLLNNIYFDIQTVPQYDSKLTIPKSIDITKLHLNLLYFKQIIINHASTKSLVFLLKERKDQKAQKHKNDTAGSFRYHGRPSKPVIPKSFEWILQDRFTAGTKLIEQGKILDGVELLRGLGNGLTPSGDDFIAGFLIALHLQQLLYGKNHTTLINDIFRIAQNNNLLSTAFLRSAKEGRVCEKLKHTISALLTAKPHELLSPTLELLSIGATSGADIAVGLIFGLERIRLYAS